jgi:hypothetical protein
MPVKNSRLPAHTDVEPPKYGRMRLPIIGSIKNNKNAAAAIKTP